MRAGNTCSPGVQCVSEVGKTARAGIKTEPPAAVVRATRIRRQVKRGFLPRGTKKLRRRDNLIIFSFRIIFNPRTFVLWLVINEKTKELKKKNKWKYLMKKQT